MYETFDLSEKAIAKEKKAVAKKKEVLRKSSERELSPAPGQQSSGYSSIFFANTAGTDPSTQGVYSNIDLTQLKLKQYVNWDLFANEETLELGVRGLLKTLSTHPKFVPFEVEEWTPLTEVFDRLFEIAMQLSNGNFMIGKDQDFMHDDIRDLTFYNARFYPNEANLMAFEAKFIAKLIDSNPLLYKACTSTLNYLNNKVRIPLWHSMVEETEERMDCIFNDGGEDEEFLESYSWWKDAKEYYSNGIPGQVLADINRKPMSLKALVSFINSYKTKKRFERRVIAWIRSALSLIKLNRSLIEFIHYIDQGDYALEFWYVYQVAWDNNDKMTEFVYEDIESRANESGINVPADIREIKDEKSWTIPDAQPFFDALNNMFYTAHKIR